MLSATGPGQRHHHRPRASKAKPPAENARYWPSHSRCPEPEMFSEFDPKAAGIDEKVLRSLPPDAPPESLAWSQVKVKRLCIVLDQAVSSKHFNRKTANAKFKPSIFHHPLVAQAIVYEKLDILSANAVTT